MSDLSRLDRHTPTSPEPSGARPAEGGGTYSRSPTCRWHQLATSLFCLYLLGCQPAWVPGGQIKALKGRSHTSPISLLFVINKFILHLLNQD